MMPTYWPYEAWRRWPREQIFMWFIFYRPDIVFEYHVDYMIHEEGD